MYENSIDEREERANERCRSGGRTGGGAGFEPGRAGGGYVRRAIEDFHGYSAKHELVASVSAAAGGDAEYIVCGGEAGRVGTSSREPDSSESEAGRGDVEPDSGAAGCADAGDGKDLPVYELRLLCIHSDVRCDLRVDLLGQLQLRVGDEDDVRPDVRAVHVCLATEAADRRVSDFDAAVRQQCG